MVKYELCVCTKNNEFKKINIDKFIFKEGDLKSIDDFTMRYENEARLKNFLLDNDLIFEEDILDEIKVFYKYDGKIKTLDVVYKDISGYLDIDDLLFQILGQGSDSTFLRKIFTKYAYLKVRNEYKNYSLDVMSNGNTPFSSQYINEDLTVLVNKIVKIKNRNGAYSVNYKNMRDLAMFVYEYISSKKLNQTVTSKKEKLSSIKQKLENLGDRQLSLEELFKDNKDVTNNSYISDEEDDDYEEPLFLPNSEEERMYREYMENLPLEYDDDESLEDDLEDRFKYKPYR